MHNGTLTMKRLAARRWRKLWLEGLEDRLAPATFIVNSTTDAGPFLTGVGIANTGDLRYAIAQADATPGADEIVFSLPANSTIRLNGIMRPITDASGLSIRGDTAVNLTISGDRTGNGQSADDVRVFFVTNNAVLAMNNLTVAGGRAEGGDGGNASSGAGGGGAGMGGGMLIDSGTVTLSNVTFTGNQAIGGGGGDTSIIGSGGGGGGAGGAGGNVAGGGGGFAGDGGEGKFGGGGGGGFTGKGGDGALAIGGTGANGISIGGGGGGGSAAAGGNGSPDGGGGTGGSGPGGGGGSALFPGSSAGQSASAGSGGAGGYGGGGGASDPTSLSASGGQGGEYGGGGAGSGINGAGGQGGFGGGGGGSSGGGGLGGFGGGGGGSSSGTAVANGGLHGGAGGISAGGFGGGGGGGLGGAIFIRNGTLTLINTTFNNNAAIHGLPGPGGSSGEGKGGALYVLSGATARSLNAAPTFTANAATEGNVVTNDNSNLFGNLTVVTGVTLTASGGTNQVTSVGTAFAQPLQVTLVDGNGTPITNVVVTFSAPQTTAGATFPNTPFAITNAVGTASVTAKANLIPGTYNATAKVAGLSASFSLTNLGPPSAINILGGDDQSTPVNKPFADPLQVTVTDSAGNPLGDIPVVFTAPIVGPSGLFNGSSNSFTVKTDALGQASVPITANSIIGSYSVSAQAFGGATTSFSLTNTGGKAIWINPNGGDWNDGKNWQSGQVPTATDDAFIDNLKPGAQVKHSANGLDLVHSVTSTGPVVVAGGGLALLNTSFFTDLIISGGTLLVFEEVKVSDSLNWSAGTIRQGGVGGEVPVPAGVSPAIFADGNMLISGDLPKVLDGVDINNFGNAVYRGRGPVTPQNAPSFNNLGGASFSYETDADFGPRFNNNGLFVKEAGLGVANMTVFLNAGRVALKAGNLHVFVYNQIDGATFLVGGALGSPNPIDIGAGSALIGPGQINGSVVSDGAVSPGPFGALKISGGYTQQSNGALNIKINGTNPGSQFGQLIVGGTASLDGAVNVVFGGGFTPQPDQFFTIILAPSIGGDFSSYNGIITPEVTLIPIFNPADLTLFSQANAQVIDDLISDALIADPDATPAPANDLLNPLEFPTLNGIVQVPIGALVSIQAKLQSGGGQNTSAGVAASPTFFLKLPKAAGVEKVGEMLEEEVLDRLQSIFDDLDLPVERDILTGAEIAGSLLTGSKPRADLLPQKGSRVAPVATLITGDAGADTGGNEPTRTDDNTLRDSLINPIQEQPRSQPAPMSEEGPRSEKLGTDEELKGMTPAGAAVAAVLLAGGVLDVEKKRRR